MTNPVLEGLANARNSAVHLEMRDAYQPTDPEFVAWQQGKRLAPTSERTLWWRPFLDVVTETTARGVAMRPGLIQTAGYTEDVLRGVQRRRVAIDDVADAVAVRMERQHVLYEGRRRFAFLVEESVLRNALGEPDTQLEQLDHLVGISALPNVSFGVVPTRVGRPRMPVYWIGAPTTARTPPTSSTSRRSLPRRSRRTCAKCGWRTRLSTSASPAHPGARNRGSSTRPIRAGNTGGYRRPPACSSGGRGRHGPVRSRHRDMFGAVRARGVACPGPIGGGVLATLTGWMFAFAQARLTVLQPGHAVGEFVPGARSFMVARAHAAPPIDYDEVVSATGDGRPTELGAEILSDWTGRFVVQGALPTAISLTSSVAGGPARTHVVDADGSYATFLAQDDGTWRVREGGRRGMWERAEKAIGLWRNAGSPAMEAFRIHITPDAQQVYLPDSELAWNLPSELPCPTGE